MRVLPLVLATLGAAGPAGSPACAQPALLAGAPPVATVVEGLTARLYATEHRAGKREPLGLAVHVGADGRETAHVGHGSTASWTPTLALVVDLGSGQASVVRADGGLEPLPETFEARREGFDADVFRMHTEGTIPAATALGVVHLDYDPLTGSTEAYVFPEGEAPRTQPIAGEGHNRDLAAAGLTVVAHTTARVGGGEAPWPALTGSLDGGRSWHVVVPAGARAFEGNGFVRLAVFRDKVYGFPSTLEGDTAPEAFAVEAEGAAGGARGLVARSLFPSPEAYWPAGASETGAFQGRRLVQWPQVRQGHEADGGLYLVTTRGLFFTPDPERTRPAPVPPAAPASGRAAAPSAVYAAHGGHLYALVGRAGGEAGHLARRTGGPAEAGRWERVAPVGGPAGGPLPFVPRLLAFAPSGALVAVGTAPDGDLALATVPAEALRPMLRGETPR